MKTHDLSVLFVGAAFGTPSSSLYWGNLWSELAECAKGPVMAIQMAPCAPEKNSLYTRSSVGGVLNLLRFFRREAHPEVLVVNEFSVSSLLSLIYFCFFRSAKRVLLIENHPKYLAGYGKRKLGLFSSLYRRFVCLFAELIVVNNLETADYVASRLRVDSKKVDVSAYLTSEFAHPELKAEPASRVLKIAAIGQLIPRKGFHQLVSALQRASSDLRRGFVVDVFGDGPCREELQQQVDAAGLGETIRFRGVVDRSYLHQNLRLYDALINVTLADYRSLIMFEALSAGLVLLASQRDGSTAETTSHQHNGFVFDPENLDDIVRSLEWLCSLDDSSRLSCRRDSLRRAENFCVRRCVRELFLSLTKTTAS